MSRDVWEEEREAAMARGAGRLVALPWPAESSSAGGWRVCKVTDWAGPR